MLWQHTLTCAACPGPGLVNADRSGFLDAKELQKALAMGNLHYGLTDVDQVQSHGLSASAEQPLMQHWRSLLLALACALAYM